MCCRHYFRSITPERALPFDAFFLWERFSLYNTMLVAKRALRFQRAGGAERQWEARGENSGNGRTYTWRHPPSAVTCLWISSSSFSEAFSNTSRYFTLYRWHIVLSKVVSVLPNWNIAILSLSFNAYSMFSLCSRQLRNHTSSRNTKHIRTGVVTSGMLT